MEIQPARPEMAPAASALIYLTMGKMADYTLGAGDARRARRMLASLFRAENNRFCHRLTDVALVSGRVVGLILSYPTSRKVALELATAADLLRFGGLPYFLDVVYRTLPLAFVKEWDGAACFIAHLAVSPDYRRRGIGCALLATVEGRARARGHRALALTVEVNSPALAFYRHLGFRITGNVMIPSLRRRLGYEGFYRLCKELA